MNVVVAKNSGFCSGVERAFQIVKKLVEDGRTPVQTYGELVHNPDVVAFLEGKGVSVAQSVDDVIKGAYLVVRAHGVPDSEMQRLKEKTPYVYDGKCPIVGKLQQGLKEKVEQGYFAVVWGKLGHPEMICVTGDLREGSYAVVGDVNEALKYLKINHHPKVYLCAQTTKDPVGFNYMAKELEVFYDGVYDGTGITFEARNTTCKPTGNAKKFARELALKCDVMVVVGGRNSENTKGLVNVCRAVYGTDGKVIPVVNGRELEERLKKGLFNGVKEVGVAAGTSTPPWVIDEVCSLLRAYN